jgi:hypothetical protein
MIDDLNVNADVGPDAETASELYPTFETLDAHEPLAIDGHKLLGEFAEDD